MVFTYSVERSDPESEIHYEITKNIGQYVQLQEISRLAGLESDYLLWLFFTIVCLVPAPDFGPPASRDWRGGGFTSQSLHTLIASTAL